MKSALKFGVLFALIIVGRYQRSTAPVVATAQPKPTRTIFQPVGPARTQYADYAAFPSVLVSPASQRKRPSSTWY